MYPARPILFLLMLPTLLAAACDGGADDKGSTVSLDNETARPDSATDTGASGDDTVADSHGAGADSSDSAMDTGTSPVQADIIHASLYNTVLGRPTDTSIAISVLATAAGDAAYVEWSTGLSADLSSLAGEVQTSAVITSADGEPIVLDLDGLSADTKYYYRVMYSAAGGSFSPDNLHSFRTQRAVGSRFSFGVQGDTHPERYNNKMFHGDLFTRTLEQVRDRQPDLYFMLGDDFSIEKIIEQFEDANFEEGHTFQKSVEGSWTYAECLERIAEPFDREMIVDGDGAPRGSAAYRALREDYLGVMANATSLFLVNGNHEQAHLANLGGVFNDASIYAAEARLKYYPLPTMGGFYTGDDAPMSSINGHPTLDAPDGLLRDYYAFEWGDALFVTIDPYWHSELVSPNGSLYDGDEDVDSWAATMGDDQYTWLAETLSASTATWKFVFAHHINGGGRGGAGDVGNQEWGGKTADFEANRPTWDKPVHQLLVDNGVTVFFQGHDHIFAREIVDGVVYQSVPNPADNSYFAYNCGAYDPDTITWKGPAGYGDYDPDQGVVMPNSGFLYVTVEPERVQIDYIRTYRDEDLAANANGVFDGSEVNGETAFSYSIPASADDDQPADFPYTCIGDEPPDDWVYEP